MCWTLHEIYFFCCLIFEIIFFMFCMVYVFKHKFFTSQLTLFPSTVFMLTRTEILILCFASPFNPPPYISYIYFEYQLNLLCLIKNIWLLPPKPPSLQIDSNEICHCRIILFHSKYK